MIGTLITGVTALMFPMFASYRALLKNDITLIRPWLMYWVVFASFEFAESAFHPILQLVPFYSLIRLGVLFWLVLPQTQGAVQLYQTHLEPWLSSHDQLVDSYIARAIEYVRDSPLGGVLALLGISLPKPPAAGSAASGPAPVSVTDALMSRFRLPATPDINLAAYLPAVMGGGGPEGSQGGPSENSSLIRNRLLNMVKYLDSRNTPDNAPTSSPSPVARDVDGYDFVETPKDAPVSLSPNETEIEREVEEKLLAGNAKASETAPPHDARRRWF